MKIKLYVPYLVWGIALMATLGSLFFQYVLDFPPCALCWYQRIFIYPLVVIIPIGIIARDRLYPIYVLILSLIGIVISMYHNLLYYKIIPEELAPCAVGIPCTTRYITSLGFIDIPFLSLVSFIMIIIGTIMIIKNKNSRI